jgi:membrane protein
VSLLSRLAPGALVGAALLASSFLGSSVSVSVRDRLEGVRDTPVDIVVTSQDPVTVLGGHRYLAPDAWMTQGSVTPDQVRALRDIPGVEVAAPVTMVDLADQDTEQVVSAWVLRPAADQDGDHLRAWRVQVTVSVTDGTGTRVSAPSTLLLAAQGRNMLLAPGTRSAINLLSGDELGQLVPVVTDQGVALEPLTAPGLSSAAMTDVSRASIVALDPASEAALARAGGDEALAASMDSLARAAADPGAFVQWARDTWRGDGSGPRADDPLSLDGPWLLSYGYPVPALVADSGLPDMTVSGQATELDTTGTSLTEDDTDRAYRCPPVAGEDCRYLTESAADRLLALPGHEVATVPTTSPAYFWLAPAHPLGVGAPSQVVTYGTMSYGDVTTDSSRTATRKEPAPLSAVDTTSPGGGPSLRYTAVAGITSSEWREEIYRVRGLVGGAYRKPGMISTGLYPVTSGSLPGTDPLAASTLRTSRGPVAQDVSGTGAVTSPAGAVIPDTALDDLALDGTRLPAGMVRLRLERPDGGAASEDDLERVAARVADMGLTPTVVTGSSPVEVSVELTGSMTGAWHGTATQQWTELGAVARVEAASSWTTRMLTVVSMLTCGLLALVVEGQASAARVLRARVLVQSGWSGPRLRARLLGARLPALAAVLLGAAAACAVSATQGSNPVVLVLAPAVGLVYVLGVVVWVLWDAAAALRPQRTGARGRRGLTGRGNTDAAGRSPRGSQESPQAGRLRLPRWGSRAVRAQARSRWRVARLRAPRAVRARVRRTVPGPVGVGYHLAGASGGLATGASVVLTGLAAGAGLTVLSQYTSQAGTSQAAGVGLSLARLATTVLVALTSVAALALLLTGLRSVRAPLTGRHQVLAAAGWSRAARVRVEVVSWGRRYVPVVLLLACLTPVVSLWVPQVPVAAIVLALAVCALALVLTAAIHLLPAVRASRPQRAPDSGWRPGPSRQGRRLWQGRLSQEDV